MPPVNVAEADVVVATSTGRGQSAQPGRDVLAQGDAATVGLEPPTSPTTRPARRRNATRRHGPPGRRRARHPDP